MSQIQISKLKFDSIYAKGFKWCSFCMDKKDGKMPNCNVCGNKLRSKPRKSKHKSVKYIE